MGRKLSRWMVAAWAGATLGLAGCSEDSADGGGDKPQKSGLGGIGASAGSNGAPPQGGATAGSMAMATPKAGAMATPTMTAGKSGGAGMEASAGAGTAGTTAGGAGMASNMPPFTG